MQLTSVFVNNIQDLYGEIGKSWIKGLPSLINELCLKWNLRFIDVMSGLTYHFIGLVEKLATREMAVIKIAPTNQNIAREVKWLQCFKAAVPHVYAYDDKNYAYLMERLTPGKSLKSIVFSNDDEATHIICQTIRVLHAEQIQQDGFKHLSELANNFLALKGRVDAKKASQAASWFNDLTSDKTNDVLLHFDLHHDNILSSGTGWKVIDPHGYIGDPVSEIGTMIYNPQAILSKQRDISKIIERRLKIITQDLGFDKHRVKQWAFCKTMLSVAWTIEDTGSVPEFELMVADIIDNIII